MNMSRSLIAAAALLAAVSAAQADNSALPVTSETTLFSDPTPLVGGIDILSFTGLAAGIYDYTVSFTGPKINVVFATFEGTPVPLATIGITTYGYLTGTVTTTGAPLLLALAGTTAGSGAGYAGFLNLSPIPEPETYAMLLAGLGALGLMASRRRNQG
ncbi:MAG: FxDxF family PEP-CTERM protein [Aquabacterium sp.]|nr:FxDxF family PEP-CTERM protein [Aquabacterium sp.]